MNIFSQGSEKNDSIFCFSTSNRFSCTSNDTKGTPVAGIGKAETIVGGSALLKIVGGSDAKKVDLLISFSEKGDLEEIRNLIASGVDVTRAKGLNGYNALHYASSNGRAAAVNELLKAGISVNSANDEEESPLHLACYAGHLLVSEQLIDNGANINRLFKIKIYCVLFEM